MYDLCKEVCEKQIIKAQKSSYYLYVFNNNFNINFHKPKTERCDRCEEIKIKKNKKIHQ